MAIEMQVTHFDKTFTEARMDREEIEQLILRHLFNRLGTAKFDWNDQTGAVTIFHTTETVKDS